MEAGRLRLLHDDLAPDTIVLVHPIEAIKHRQVAGRPLRAADAARVSRTIQKTSA